MKKITVKLAIVVAFALFFALGPQVNAQMMGPGMMGQGGYGQWNYCPYCGGPIPKRGYGMMGPGMMGMMHPGMMGHSGYGMMGHGQGMGP